MMPNTPQQHLGCTHRRQPNEVIPTKIHKIYGSHSFTCVCDQDEQVWNFCDGPDGSHSCAVAMLSISSSDGLSLSYGIALFNFIHLSKKMTFICIVSIDLNENHIQLSMPEINAINITCQWDVPIMSVQIGLKAPIFIPQRLKTDQCFSDTDRLTYRNVLLIKLIRISIALMLNVTNSNYFKIPAQ